MCEASAVIDPEIRLANLIKEELNVDINPQALRMFIRSKWNRVSVLAHSIHGFEDETQRSSLVTGIS